jgi:hypothetical protein
LTPKHKPTTTSTIANRFPHRYRLQNLPKNSFVFIDKLLFAYKSTKKTERSKEYSLLLSVLPSFFLFRDNSITFRGARQKQLTSYDPLRGVKPTRGDHSLWPFSHGSRACSRDGDCAAETFFSLLFFFIL